MGLAIVIVNWNSGELLNSCLASIGPSALRLPESQPLERVVVVDNGSSDGSQHIDAMPGLPLQLIQNTDNRGFAAACNQGAAACKSDLLLFLNPDTRLFEDSLRVAIDALLLPRSKPVGIVGIALQDDSGSVVPSCSRFPRAHHYLAHTLGIDRLWPRLGQPMVEWDHLDTRTVDQIMGAFFFMHRSLFDTLGGFDERFFVYLEEVDLSLRARQAGWASLHVAEARAYHKGGGTSNAVRARRLFYSLRSRLKYATKHYGLVERALAVAVVWVLEPLSRAVFLILRGARVELRELVQAYRWLWRDERASTTSNGTRPADRSAP